MDILIILEFPADSIGSRIGTVLGSSSLLPLQCLPQEVHSVQAHNHQVRDTIKKWINDTITSRGGGWLSTFLRDILSKGMIWESVDQRVVEQQEKGEGALERLLARQEETAALVRGLVEQVELYPHSYLYLSVNRWRSCASKEGGSRGR